ncbi:restriction endonuclease [Riemerella anatipestifer]|nr:restriction endonuclease [Riemerella anatipestifer]MBT0562333.1 restriction endonuclease [Riemerella anatipestifer]MCO4304981.1 restriction endonuclease [Riemerella anatipestifer]MCO7331188.1 restriction endonuclease [Riemerella anatipestifer]MCO7350341.1 restriction endonuclease [Riemerella anatipestifer]MCO7353854.1 restriction endonuclease [Riemerella anatipestifer]
MEWKEYEEITKYIYETLGAANGVKIECHGNNCKVTGKSTVVHQIDVLTSHSDGLHSYKTAVECKYWEQTINKDIIMKVAEIVEDAGLNKGVIVSKNGFTPDAISFAKYKNIGLIELREPNEDDWKGRVKNIQINMNMLLPQINGLELLVSKETKSTLKPGSTRVEFLDIKKTDGSVENIEKYINEFNNELCKKEENEVLEKVFTFDTGTVLIYKPTGEETEISGVKLNGILRIAKETIEIKGEDHIYMIMKSIFEDKSYTITKDKKINERQK